MNEYTITNKNMLIEALTELNPQIEFTPPIDNNSCMVLAATKNVLTLQLPSGFYFSQLGLGLLKITNRYCIDNTTTPCVVILIREKAITH